MFNDPFVASASALAIPAMTLFVFYAERRLQRSAVARSRRFAAIGAVILGPMLAWSFAEPREPPATDGKIKIVKYPGTTGTYEDAARIFISGVITPQMGSEFVRRTEKIAKAEVWLESPGGSVAGAIAMGEAIHRKGYSTYLAPGTACFSSCAFIWIAAGTRHIGVDSALAWHAAFNQGSPDRASGGGNAALGFYLAQLGYNYSELDKMIGESPQTIFFTKTDKEGRISNGVLTVPTEAIDAGAPK